MFWHSWFRKSINKDLIGTIVVKPTFLFRLYLKIISWNYWKVWSLMFQAEFTAMPKYQMVYLHSWPSADSLDLRAQSLRASSERPWWESDSSWRIPNHSTTAPLFQKYWCWIVLRRCFWAAQHTCCRLWARDCRSGRGCSSPLSNSHSLGARLSMPLSPNHNLTHL